MAGTATIQTAVLASLPPGDCLTVEALAASSGLTRRQVVFGAAGLIGRGYAERAEIGCFRLTEAGADARTNGVRLTSGPLGPLSQALRRQKRTTLRDRLWRALRIKGKATVGELLEAAGGDTNGAVNNAQHYCRALRRAGYLRRMRRRIPGTSPTSNGFIRYQLVRDSGSQAPVVRADGTVFDLNTREDHR